MIFKGGTKKGINELKKSKGTETPLMFKYSQYLLHSRDNFFLINYKIAYEFFSKINSSVKIKMHK